MKKQLTSLTLGAILLSGTMASAGQKVSVSRAQFGLATLRYSQGQIDNLFRKNVLQLDPIGELVIVDLQKLQALSDTELDVATVSMVRDLQDLLSDQTAIRYVEPEDMRLSTQDRSGSNGGG